MQSEYIKRGGQVAAQAGLVVCCVWWSLVCAWYGLSAVNFAFPVVYEMAGIGENIAQYAPQNRYKRGFELTPRKEHERLFAQIVHAINHNGEGLADISYRGPDGLVIDRFLRMPEVIHLQDVANLLANLRLFCWYIAGLTLVLVGFHVYFHWPVSNTWRAGLGLVMVLAMAILGLTFLGATDVFYSLHTRIFPDGHQWFFFYQESLMTTLMKAPDLFAYIGLLLAVGSVGIFIAFWTGLRRLLYRARTQTEVF
jgi:hypothetical protein